MRALVQASDEALGGSEWLQAFAHTPDLFKPFARFYYDHLMTDSEGLPHHSSGEKGNND